MSDPVIHEEIVLAQGVRLSIRDEEGHELARAWLYVLRNNLHSQPFGFLEDVFVTEEARRGGLATKIVQSVIERARAHGCYKLVDSSRFDRPWVHLLYEKLGFRKHGFAFRLDLADNPNK